MTVFSFCSQAKPEDTLDLCKLLNDDLARTVKKHPTRFVGLGTLPMQVCIITAQSVEMLGAYIPVVTAIYGNGLYVLWSCLGP